MSKQAEPFDSFTGFVVIAATRYALTRASYAVGLVADWVWANWSRLSPSDRAVIERDVREELDPMRAVFCGHPMDRRTWEALLQKIVTARCERCKGTGRVSDYHGDVKPCPSCEEARSSARSEHRPDKAGVGGSSPPEPTKVCKRCQDVGRVRDPNFDDSVFRDGRCHVVPMVPCPICQRTKLPPSLAEDIVEAVTDHAEGMEGGSVLYDVSAAIKDVERLLETELGAASKRS